MVAEKQCTKCGEVKPGVAFYATPRTKNRDGLTSHCRACVSAASKKWRAKNLERHTEKVKQWQNANRDRLRENNKRYAAENPDRMKVLWKKWRVNNAEHLRENAARWAKENPERKGEINKKWRDANPEMRQASAETRRTRKAAAPGHGVSGRQWKQLCHEYGYRCAYCALDAPLTLDHLEPLSKGGAHDVSNCVPSCLSCNASKGALSLLQWRLTKHLGRTPAAWRTVKRGPAAA